MPETTPQRRRPIRVALSNDYGIALLGLAQRESEILTFITRGLTNDEIARRSFLSINTVKSYLRNAHRKIGAKSRPQPVTWGYPNGFQSAHDTGP